MRAPDEGQPRPASSRERPLGWRFGTSRYRDGLPLVLGVRWPGLVSTGVAEPGAATNGGAGGGTDGRADGGSMSLYRSLVQATDPRDDLDNDLPVR